MNQTNFPQNDYLYPPLEESTRLLVGCRAEDYSASRIAHAVEDCNAHLLNLNITSPYTQGSEETRTLNPDDIAQFPVLFDMRVSIRNAASIARSLERYGYHVLDALEPQEFDDETSYNRYLQLMKYLEM